MTSLTATASASISQQSDATAANVKRIVPYTTTKHRVTKGRYITSTDPRGYVPVYEYPLNNQWIMMDVDDGYVLWTGIWKALGNSKADIVKMIESQPDLASQLRRVRGGYLKIQGTWLPYEVALQLAKRVAWTIREDLIPLFGPQFPESCLSPDQPGYGQVVASSGRRRARRPAAQSQPTPLQDESGGTSTSSGNVARPPSRPGPYSPSFHDSNHFDYSPAHMSTYSSSLHDRSGPSPGPGVSGNPLTTYHPRSNEERFANSSEAQYYGVFTSPQYRPSQYSPISTDHSYQSSPPIGLPGTRRASEQHSARSNSISDRDPRFDLPSISTIGLDHEHRQHNFSLPPIGALREGDKPDMDASVVLRRLKLEDSMMEGSGKPSRPYSTPPLHSAAGSSIPPSYSNDTYSRRSHHGHMLEKESSRHGAQTPNPTQSIRPSYQHYPGPSDQERGSTDHRYGSSEISPTSSRGLNGGAEDYSAARYGIQSSSRYMDVDDGPIATRGGYDSAGRDYSQAPGPKRPW